MKPVICFGEILAQLAAPGHRRLRQCLPGQLQTNFAGAEANVAVALSQLGTAAEFVSAMPANALGEACVAALAGAAVGTRHILRPARGRFGLYFLEDGASVRGGKVLYDREGSSFALTGGSAYPWSQVFAGAGWFHYSGIAPAVSAVAAEATETAVRAARAAGLPISCDLNFRRQLWTWKEGTAGAELARQTLEPLVTETDLLVANPSDLSQLLGQGPRDISELGADALRELAVAARRRFPRLRWVAITLRRCRSASSTEWGGCLFDAQSEAFSFAPLQSDGYQPYRIEPIVDRVGAGDAFTAGLIFALNTPELQAPATAVAFAAAAGALAHTVPGDFFFVSRAEVEHVMRDDSGQLSR